MMSHARKLDPEQLTCRCSPDQFPFQTTADVEPVTDIIGQDRAVAALRFGIGMSSSGYNIFVSGPSGTGRTTYTTDLVRQTAAAKTTPSDWCYVFDFAHPNEPAAIELPPGQGTRFAHDMAQTLAELKAEIPRAFDSEDYDKQRAAIMRTAQDEAAAILNEVETEAARRGFSLVKTASGISPVPMIDNKPATREQFDALPADEKARLNSLNTEIQELLTMALRRVRDRDRAARSSITELNRTVAANIISPAITDLQEGYSDVSGVNNYLSAWQSDMMDNIDKFLPSQSPPPPVTGPQPDFFIRYEVNLLIDNSEQQGAPVIIETNPTYHNLMGKIEYRTIYGAMSTDFTMIKPGSLHRASGGYLIINATDILTNPLSWDALKRALNRGQANVENSIDPRMGLVTGITPKEIPISVRVILIGPPLICDLLQTSDEQFNKLFKIRADFDTEMERCPEQEIRYGAFTAAICDRHGLAPFDRTAVARVVDHSSRLVGHQHKLSTRFNKILDLILESARWCELAGDKIVSADHVRQAIHERRHRVNLTESKLQEMIQKGQLLIDVAGMVPGQINGLVVHTRGSYQFGRPSRITVRSFASSRGLIDIEREAELGGKLHSKGILILGGYMGAHYAQTQPLTLSATICMEQSYVHIEGDSASAAELLALLSATAGIPLDQGIAMTGSVNQRGEIQPVGGISAKVEGYFQACRLLGLTGTQGVIIPRQNEANLVLDDEVIDAVTAGQFHIYSIGHIDEAIKLCTGTEPGKADEHGHFPAGTFHHAVYSRLAEWALTLRKHRYQETEHGY